MGRKKEIVANIYSQYVEVLSDTWRDMMAPQPKPAKKTKAEEEKLKQELEKEIGELMPVR